DACTRQAKSFRGLDIPPAPAAPRRHLPCDRRQAPRPVSGPPRAGRVRVRLPRPQVRLAGEQLSRQPECRWQPLLRAQGPSALGPRPPRRSAAVPAGGRRCRMSHELPDYDAWLRSAKDATDLDVLLRWAWQTLPAPVVPCGCCDMTCLRCQVARIAGERE